MLSSFIFILSAEGIPQSYKINADPVSLVSE